MEKYPIAWGLDIGRSSIKAVKLSRENDGVATVLGYAIEPITVGENVDHDEAVLKALELLATREEMGGAPVVASLSGNQIFARTINIPVINPKKVEKMVELEARQKIPGNFDEIEWSYHLSPAADGASNDVAIFAAKREIIDELVGRCKKVGINIAAVSVSSLALYNFIRYDQEFPEDETIIILDVGAENTDLVLYQGETLWMRTLLVSGNDITKAFMKKFRVSFEEAETLKRQIGDSRQADKIFKVIENSLNELTSEVQRSLGFYKQTNANAKLENIVISGNTFRLPNLPQFLADRLRYAVISLEDLERIQLASDLDRDHFLADLQSLGVAMGLALQGIGMAKSKVNLLPSTLRLERLLRSKRWAAVAVLAILFITLMVTYWDTSSVLTDNTGLSKDIAHEDSENSAQEKDSLTILHQIGPLAASLAEFKPYGHSKGLALAVTSGILGVIQQIVVETGPVGSHDAPPDKEGGDPELQAAYLESIDMPAFDYHQPSGPFRPLATARTVTVSVRIPKTANAKTDIGELVVNRLRALPTPDYLKALHPGDKLFDSVQSTSEVPSVGTYSYVDEHHLDEKGNMVKQKLKLHFPAVLATYQCTISAATDKKEAAQ